MAEAVVTHASDVQDDPGKSPDYQLTVSYLDPTGRHRTVELAVVVNYPYEAGEHIKVLYKPDNLDYVLPGLLGAWLTEAILVPVLLAVGPARMVLRCPDRVLRRELCCGSELLMRQADQVTDLIPRSVLFGDHGKPSPRLSPDGTRIAFIDGRDGVANVWAGPVDNPAAAVPVTHDRGHGIRSYMFCDDDKTLLYVQDTDGDENWRLYALDLPTGEVRLLTPGSGVRATILGSSHFHPTTIVIGLLATDSGYIDPYLLDLTTGALEQLATNPGYQSWLIDPDLRIRGGATITEDGGREIHLRDLTTGQDTLWMTLTPEDSAASGHPVFDRDGNIYLGSSTDAQHRRLLRMGSEGEVTVLAQHDHADLVNVYSDPLTMRPQSAVFLGDRKIWHHLDPEFGATIDRLRERLDGEISISRPSGSDARWLVAETSDRAGARFYLYDRATEDLTPLFADRAELDDYEFAPMEPFAVTARDGLRIHGYLTFPVGLPRTGLPAVLLVHGGPAVRDSWGHSPRVQWLANRGYAVIQVNFRGSNGYGKAFLLAGDKEWGRAMHHDLLDAVDHVVGQGWVDPKRIAIYGGSYGGYAALVGAAFTPEVFRAAIDICGPSNLLTLIGSLSAQNKTQIGSWHRRVGNPDTERDMLWERSPLSRAADIRIPVMIVQGRNDPRVRVEEAEQIVAALSEAGIAHEYLLFDDEGHGIAKPHNAERLNAAIEAFLATHLGGRAQPPAN